MGQERLFGELRSLMQEAPSDEVWRRIVWALDRRPGEALEAEVLPYVFDYVKGWPEALERRVPDQWVNGDALRRGYAPHLLVCATLWWQFMEVDPQQIVWLAACPHARNLRTLNLEGAIVTADAMMALANSPNLGALKTLSVELALCEGALDELALAQGLPSLRALSLMANELNADSLRALRRGRLLGQLVELELAFNNLSGGMMRWDGMRWESIERLDLRGCDLGYEDALALSRLDAPRLHMLAVSGNPLTRAGVAALLASETLPALATLELKDCHLELADIDALAAQGAARGVSVVAYEDQEGEWRYIL